MEEPMEAMTTRAAAAAPPPPPEGWRDLPKGELAALCRAAGVPAAGGRAALVKRLAMHYHGSSRDSVHGLVVCRHCGSGAGCIGTRWMSDSLIRRTYRCRGRRRHTFTIDTKAAPARDPQEVPEGIPDGGPKDPRRSQGPVDPA